MIRPVEPADAPAIAAIYAPYVVADHTSFEEIAPEADEIAARIAATTSTHPWLVAVDERGIAGYAYATTHRARAAYRHSVETSVYIARDRQRRGHGRRLYEVLLAELAERRFARAFAGIALPNEPSIALHRSLGFTPIGVFERVGYKHGAWRDVAWFGRDV